MRAFAKGEMEQMIRDVYPNTTHSANGFDLESALSEEGKEGLVYQLFEQMSYLKDSIYAVTLIHSDGGVRDWALYQMIAGHPILINRYQYPFTDCFEFDSVSEMARLMKNTLDQIISDLLLDLTDDSPAKKEVL